MIWRSISAVSGDDKGFPTPIQVNIEPTDKPSLTQAFDVNLQLAELTDKDGDTKNNYYEMSTVNTIELELYEGDKENGRLWGRASLNNRNMSNYDAFSFSYNSTIRQDYSDQSVLITPETFGKNNSHVTAEYYTLVVKPATDYTEHENKIPVVAEREEPAEFTITPHGFVPSLPADVNNALRVVSVVNGVMQDAAGQNLYPELKYNSQLNSDTIVGYSVNANTYPINGMAYAKEVTYRAWRIAQYDASGNPVYDTTGTPVAQKTIAVPEGSSVLPGWVVPVGQGEQLKRGNQYFFTYEVKLNLSPGGAVETPAEYPKDAVNGTGKVLRSTLQSCQKETPRISMYLKGMSKTGGSYTQTWVYQYQDVDGAYTNEPFKILNGTVNRTAPWNVDYDGTSKLLQITPLTKNTVEIRKDIALFDPIINYSGASSRDLVASQPIVQESIAANVTALGFAVEYDASRIKVSLDRDKVSQAYMKCIPALKITVSLKDDPSNKKVFDYVPLDSSYVASVPLLSMVEYRGREIVVNVEAYYDDGFMGTDMAAADAPVLLLNYSRTSQYSYDGNLPTAAGALYRVGNYNAMMNSLFSKDAKSFEAIRLYNSLGKEKLCRGEGCGARLYAG